MSSGYNYHKLIENCLEFKTPFPRIDMDDKIATFLSKTEPFLHLSNEKQRTVASKMQIVEYEVDTILCTQQKTRIENIFVIYQGALALYYQENGKKTLNGLLKEGDIYGGISLLVSDGFAPRTVCVKEKATLFMLPENFFMDICENNTQFADFFSRSLGKQILDRSYLTIISKMALEKKNIITQTFSQKVSKSYQKNSAYCLESASIKEAAMDMNKGQNSHILIKNDNNQFTGIITDKDFREKVAAGEVSLDSPVKKIMSGPLIGISVNATISDAALLMTEKGIKHLVVYDAEDNIIGITSNNNLLMATGQSPVTLVRELKRAPTPNEIAEKQKQIAPLVKELIMGGANAEYVNRIVTTISDVIIKKLVDLAIGELGPAPVEFVFMVLGSEGRQEQTLKTDQDNAIVFKNTDKAGDLENQKYFLKLGEKVCGWLDNAGYDYCQGDIMASNPQWCQPLSVWKGYFKNWIHNPEPDAIVNATIFFDFLGVYGDLYLAKELKHHLFDLLKKQSQVFFYHLVSCSLRFKPPMGFFKNFVVESKGEHRDTFDIKKAMTPIVDYARCKALKHNIEATNTLERLKELFQKQLINEKDYHDLQQSYRYLMQIRFARQAITAFNEQKKPDNYINPKKLNYLEQKMLKEIFGIISKFQTEIALDHNISG